MVASANADNTLFMIDLSVDASALETQQQSRAKARRPESRDQGLGRRRTRRAAVGGQGRVRPCSPPRDGRRLRARAVRTSLRLGVTLRKAFVRPRPAFAGRNHLAV